MFPCQRFAETQVFYKQIWHFSEISDQTRWCHNYIWQALQIQSIYFFTGLQWTFS